jgi:Tol biopolymer transport system component
VSRRNLLIVVALLLGVAVVTMVVRAVQQRFRPYSPEAVVAVAMVTERGDIPWHLALLLSNGEWHDLAARVHIGLAWSPDGAYLAFHTGRGEYAPEQIAVLDVQANAILLCAGPLPQSFASWCRDGRHFLLQRPVTGTTREAAYRSAEALFRHDVVTGAEQQLFPLDPHEWGADASPVDDRFLLSRRDGHVMSIWIKEGPGMPPQRVTPPELDAAFPAWSPRGDRIAFLVGDESEDDIWRVDPDGEDLRQLTDAPGLDNGFAWSPDGRRIAFRSERRGRPQVWIMDSDGSAQRMLADIDEGPGFLRWSPLENVYFADGLQGDPRVVTIDASTGKRQALRIPYGYCGDFAWRPRPRTRMAE